MNPPSASTSLFQQQQQYASAISVCEVIQIDDEDLDTEHLRAHLIHDPTKQQLLSQDTTSFTPTIDAQTLLTNLSRLAPSLAKSFQALEPPTQPQPSHPFALRLINDSDYIGEETSYIALSYVRRGNRYGTTRREVSTLGDLPFGWLRTVEEFPLPVGRGMFAALMGERGEGEGVWLDQVCINQDDETETSIAIGHMHSIYRNARAVVIALDDVVVQRNEVLVLRQYVARHGNVLGGPGMQQPNQGLSPPFMRQVPLFWSLVERMLSSAWFERAWCALEMRAGRNHVFLIPCAVESLNEYEMQSTLEPTEFLRFTGDFLVHLLVLAIEVVPPQHALYTRIRALLKHFFSIYAATQQRIAPRPPSLLHLIPEIFSLKAGGNPRLPSHLRQLNANRDRVAIILNLSRLPIALKPASAFDRPSIEDECIRQLQLIALAAGDARALCSTGPALKLHDGSLSWLSRPSSLNINTPGSQTSPNVPRLLDEDLTALAAGHDGRAEYAQLPLTFLTLPHRNQHNPNRQSHIQRATIFIETAIQGAVQTSRQANSLWNFWQINPQHARAPSLKNVFVQTLACVFDCGPEWVADVWDGLSGSSSTSGKRSPPSTSRLPLEILEIMLHPNLMVQSFILTPEGQSHIALFLDFLSEVIRSGIPWSATANEMTHGPMIVTPPSPHPSRSPHQTPTFPPLPSIHDHPAARSHSNSITSPYPWTTSPTHSHSLSNSSYASTNSTFTPPTLSPCSSPPFASTTIPTISSTTALASYTTQAHTQQARARDRAYSHPVPMHHFPHPSLATPTLTPTLSTTDLPSPAKHKSNSKALIFAPYSHSKTLLLAIPSCLSRTAYASLERAWVLVPRQQNVQMVGGVGGVSGGSGGSGAAVQWEVQGKARVLGDRVFEGCVEGAGRAKGRAKGKEREHWVFGAEA